MGMRLYPVGGAPWRRLLFPVVGSLGIGYLLYRYFPDARGSGVPQTKAALYAREGRITLRTVLGKFFCTSRNPGQWNPTGTRGAVRPGRGGHRFRARPLSGAASGKSEGAAAGRRSGRHCGCVQHAFGGGVVCARRNCRRPSRAGAGLGRAGVGHVLGGAAPAARQ